MVWGFFPPPLALSSLGNGEGGDPSTSEMTESCHPSPRTREGWPLGAIGPQTGAQGRGI